MGEQANPEAPSPDRLAARRRAVEEHIRRENTRDLDAIMDTFGDQPRYDDEAWDEHYVGHPPVRAFYEQLLRALPDLSISVRHHHQGPRASVVECTISGTQQGPWRGLPPTGRRLRFPLCAVYTFDEQDRLAGERIYYDRATVLRQLGVLREPESLLARLTIPILHPVTMLRSLLRALGRR